MFDFLAVTVCGLLACGEPCRDVTHRAREFVACSFDTRQVSVRLHLNGEDDLAFGTLRRAEDSLPDQPLLLMNAGMYHSDLTPVGLYVEYQRRMKRLSTKGGWGNFHLLPNGVFWTKDGKTHVTETRRFARLGVTPDFATQSGPMLVIDGKLHHRFLDPSESLKIRNGVGVSKDGLRVTFSISKEPVSFHEFGTLFRDEIGVANALFLDGTISSIRSDHYRRESWRPLGPIISVTRK